MRTAYSAYLIWINPSIYKWGYGWAKRYSNLPRVTLSAVHSFHFHDSVQISMQDPLAPLGLLHNDLSREL